MNDNWKNLHNRNLFEAITYKSMQTNILLSNRLDKLDFVVIVKKRIHIHLSNPYLHVFYYLHMYMYIYIYIFSDKCTAPSYRI